MHDFRSLGMVIPFVALFTAQSGATRPRIEAPATEFAFPATPPFRVTGLTPRQTVVLRVEAQTGPTPVSSETQFTADRKGVISIRPSRRGATGDAASSPFWNVMPAEGADQAALQAYDNQQWNEKNRTWRVSVLTKDAELARRDFTQRLLNEKTDVRLITESGVSGVLFRPHKAKKPGCILVIGGSDGNLGWQGTAARALANEGYCALALAYFKYEGLPPTLSEIPLEYFGNAVRWLSVQPGIDPNKIGVVGYSKGGEAALLFASTHPSIRFVAGLVPSPYVFQAVRGPVKSSWTFRGQPVPFVPYDPESNWRAERKPLATMYEASLQTNAASVPAATIALEKINGPALILTGDADWSWASSRMATEALTRLRKRGVSRLPKHKAYPNAGHSLAYPDFWVPIGIMPLGPSESIEGTASARIEAWRELVAFLDKNA